MESFIRVMGRAELDPRTLSAQPQAAEQAALVRAAVAGYGRSFADRVNDLSNSEQASEEALRGFGREFEDLSEFAALVPEVERRALEAGHSRVESLIAQHGGKRGDVVAAHIEKVRAAWAAKSDSAGGVAASSLAAPPRRAFDRKWTLQKAPAGTPAAPSRLFATVPTSHFDSVVLSPRGGSRILSASPIQFVRGAYGFLAQIGYEIFGGIPKGWPLPAVEATRLTVVSKDDPVLLRRATEATPEEIASPEFQRFLDDLAHTMKKEGGSGLAAPQVGRSVRAAVVKLMGGSLLLINPKVSVLGSDVAPHLEGCLSIPNELAFVSRPQKIKIDYLDRGGRAQSVVLSGYPAVIAQHEIDHLDGLLFTMRAKNPLSKLKAGKFRAIAETTRLEFAWFSAQLKGRPDLKEINAKLLKSFHDATEPDSPAYALREGLDRPSDDGVFKEIHSYYKIRLDSHGPTEKAELLRSWLKSPAHALFAHEDLEVETLEGDGELLRELTARVPEMDVFKTPYMRGPPRSAKAVAVPGAAGGSEERITLDSVAEAVEFARLALKYALVKTPQGPRLAFPSPDGDVHVVVSSLKDARFLAESYETSAADDVRDLRLLTPAARNVRFSEDMPISFGLESEMTLEENPEIVMDYRLKGVAEADWLNMNRGERLLAVREDDRLNSANRNTEPLFQKLSGSPAELPDSLSTEIGGNFEMKGMIFRSYSELERFVRDIFRRYGPSSLQAHVVYKNDRKVEGVAGYVVFEADATQLKTLAGGYKRFLSDPRVIPAKNFRHPWLGPLGESDRKLFAKFEVRALKGKSVGSPGLSRLTYAPVLRDDVYPPGYLGHEFRQFHKRADALLAVVDNYSAHLNNSGDLRAFKPFSQVRQITSDLPLARARALGVDIDARAWRAFFTRVGAKIDALFPNVNKGGAKLSDRFFYPLKDWRAHPIINESSEPQRTRTLAAIDTATREFMVTVDALVRRESIPRWKLSKSVVTLGGLFPRERDSQIEEGVLRELQIAVAKWAHDAALSEHFETFRSRALVAGPRAPPLEQLPFVRSVRVVAGDRTLPDALPFQTNKFPNGREYLRSKMPRTLELRSPTYQAFINSTLEVIYQSAVPYGHISLRVGGRLYSLNYIESVTRTDFLPGRVGKGKTGFVYTVDPAQISKIQDELEKLVKNSAENNVPAFDAHSLKLEVIRKSDGSLKYDSPYFLFANSRQVRARLSQEDGKSFLETPDGFRYPITEEAGKLYTQSLACGTLATYVMKNYFGIDIGFDHGAQSLRQELSRGNPDGRAPDAIIDY
ncbi:MAG: peptide deformylase [Elusimicrobia bacterium]|nr:peptide deformylase [Elusimicrobiota bacterium]